ncbi:GMC family oxidoreductase [Lewinellaceae bacterium SD302]|nr:GMC family oxidoreductase [Lewinellaceae bacterium SD302]
MNFSKANQNDRTYDAIVVGTGISGGWAAMELCQKGLKTLVLERGRMLQHGDYPYASLDDWEIKYNNLLPRSVKQKHYYKLSRKEYIARQSDVPFFCKDDEYPYTEKRRFDWIRGYQVGGRSLTWGRQTYRLSDLDFEANLRDGIAVDWPIRYADLKPWYDYVERFVGVSGQNEGLSHFPDGNYLPAMPLNCVEEDFKVAMGKQLNRVVTSGRAAHLTAYDPKIHLGPRGNCQYRDRCRRGCPFGGYFSSLSSTLPVAEQTGNLTLRADSAVKQLLVDPAGQRAKGVLVRDTQSGQDLEFFSRGPVFLCASTLNSTAILLNTRDGNYYPDGLGNSSGQLGRNLMDHHHRIGAYADFDGHNDQYNKGRRPNGFYIPRFVNLNDKNSQRGYLRGFGYQGSGSRSNWMRAVRELDTTIGPELKEKMLRPGGWRIGMTAFGESLPNPGNRITLNHDLLDKDGLPTLIMDAAFGENERAMRKEMKIAAAEMLDAAGGKNIATYETEAHPGFSIHEMGTARMGRDPKTSVLNAHNQVWDCPNVYVTDGAAMVSAACVNPSNTYMALTARAVAHAIKE